MPRHLCVDLTGEGSTEELSSQTYNHCIIFGKMRSERMSSKESIASKRWVTLMYRKRELCSGKSSLTAGKQHARSFDPSVSWAPKSAFHRAQTRNTKWRWWWRLLSLWPFTILTDNLNMNGLYCIVSCYSCSLCCGDAGWHAAFLSAAGLCLFWLFSHTPFLPSLFLENLEKKFFQAFFLHCFPDFWSFIILIAINNW